MNLIEKFSNMTAFCTLWTYFTAHTHAEMAIHKLC